MGKEKAAIVFKTGQLICPFRGHQQCTRPRQPHNQAWAHNGICEGTPGCLYINAYNTFRKNQALSYQNAENNKFNKACGLMA